MFKLSNDDFLVRLLHGWMEREEFKSIFLMEFPIFLCIFPSIAIQYTIIHILMELEEHFDHPFTPRVY